MPLELHPPHPFFTHVCILLAHYNKSIICALNLNFASSKIKQPIAYGELLVHACHFYASYACIEQNQICTIASIKQADYAEQYYDM